MASVLLRCCFGSLAVYVRICNSTPALALGSVAADQAAPCWLPCPNPGEGRGGLPRVVAGPRGPAARAEAAPRCFGKAAQSLALVLSWLSSFPI